MTLNISGGFIIPKCASVYIDNDDSKKLGISAEDWAKVDKNGDYLISIDELLQNGLGVSSVYNAYKQLAMSAGAYVDPAKVNQVNQTNPINPLDDNNFAKNSVQQPFNLNHPQVISPFLANNCDFMA